MTTGLRQLRTADDFASKRGLSVGQVLGFTPKPKVEAAAEETEAPVVTETPVVDAAAADTKGADSNE